MSFREVSAERVGEWVAKGRKRRHFFPHRFYVLPKCGPDGFKLAVRMCGKDDPSLMRELVLYADEAMLGEFPHDLFFNDDLIWHQQQFGRAGQVASANLVLDGPTVYSMVHISDLVQRISRRREHKTRVENRFKGWAHMLLNAVVGFAQESGARRLRTPTAELAWQNTDPVRTVGFDLFERVYDRVVTSLFPARRAGGWWVIEVADAGDRVLQPERATEKQPLERTVCICHDVERGIGHEDVDPAFAKRAEQTSPGDLEDMLRIEAELGVRATYCVVGSLLSGLRRSIEPAGHCVAFHSFDHRLEREDQLPRCRDVDYRIKGYRPPRSRITAELGDRNLLFHNFEWLASSELSLGAAAPEHRAGLVKIPIAFDDFAMHSEGLPYEEWERGALERIADNDFLAFGLHDCYAGHWLPGYRRFLERVCELGRPRTLDEIAAAVVFAAAD